MADNTFGGQEKSSLPALLKNMLMAFVKSFLACSGANWFLRKLGEFLASYGFDSVIKPAVDYGFKKLGYIVSEANGEKRLERLSKATNPSDWHRAANDSLQPDDN